MYYLKGDVITDGRMIKDCLVEITNGEITYVGSDRANNHNPLYEVNDGFICPGLTDIHIHGVNGFDFMDNHESFAEIAKCLPRYGVTSFLATSRTGSLKNVKHFLAGARAYKDSPAVGANFLGVHIEGPWISHKYSGAQSKSYIRQLTWGDVDNVLNPFLDIISIITLAPEEIEDYAILNQLHSKEVHISAGHTNATIEEIGIAIEYGLTQVTHTFNAMSPVHHRTPGTAAASLYYDNLTCEIIADGIHIHPQMIELLYKVKGNERIVLVSDCTGYNELDDGEYFFREKNLIKNGDKVTLNNGQLAGSAITLDKGIKYVVEQCNIPLEKAIYMATQEPLYAIDQGANRGRIDVGYKADLMILGSNLDVEKTIINGDVVYNGGA
ncbi:N-acetylglucosamine-6-phosphate deacetylase [Sediminibacillus albus]|uniref:N-acetylglucosamine-6-phosphate deacetylase n=1 Tax=Sediminibacillus albus TaxID=407036 RepID=A0A1G8Y8E4_9BACI|nr:N-acetylglucosamine-6-phosphate deacetylase [Sediminibacillus albus]SDJ99092.1 N-acetylglucosamine-6-phosphate deacetylase [Sediminibacillus albus]